MRTAAWRMFGVALAAIVCGAVLLVLAIAGSTRAAEDDSRVPDDARLVEWFEAMKLGEIEVKVIPRDAERITLQVKNNTPQPLRIRAPEGAVAAPVLAQFPVAGGNPGRGNRGATPAAPQSLGVGFPNGGANNGRAPNLGPFNGGIMSVPSGRTIKVRLPAVCLEYGKHEPRALNEYELVPLANLSHKPALRELLLEFGTGRYSQKAIQAAAWHLADGISFKDLAAMSAQDEFNRRVQRFHPAEVGEAEELVKALPSIKNPPKASGP